MFEHDVFVPLSKLLGCVPPYKLGAWLLSSKSSQLSKLDRF